MDALALVRLMVAPCQFHAASIHRLTSNASQLLRDKLTMIQVHQLHTSAAAHLEAAVAAVAPNGQPAPAAHSSSKPDKLQPVQQQQQALTSLLTGLGSKNMGEQHIGLYYDFQRALMPEAFQPFHQAFYSPRPSKQQRKGGCRSLQAEFTLSNSSSLMWRRSSHELMQALSSGDVPQVHLKGCTGTGKSIAVVQMVEWARSNGWIALYVPSAVSLIRGGFFYKRSDSDSYDTIISAQHILKSMHDNHAADLAKLPLLLGASQQLLRASGNEELPGSLDTAAAEQQLRPGVKEVAAAAVELSDGSSDAATAAAAAKEQQKKAPGKKGAAGADKAAAGAGNLLQLVLAGLGTSSDGMLAVECCLALVKELAAVSHQQPVLLAVDDYNALYWTTEYGRTLFRQPENRPAYSVRQLLTVEQLNLARNLRLLERDDLGACRVLVADSSSNRVPPSATAPSGNAGVYYMPRFSEVEQAHALYYYHERGLLAQAPTARQVAAMRSLTNGSGADLRRWCLQITQVDMGLL